MEYTAPHFTIGSDWLLLIANHRAEYLERRPLRPERIDFARKLLVGQKKVAQSGPRPDTHHVVHHFTIDSDWLPASADNQSVG